jgi:ABC-type multidrug transport system ATPase subunit
MKLEISEQQEDELSISGLSKRFGAYQVLSDVSFTVISGEILGLIGPNGAGKSTLLECIAGLLPVETGFVNRQGQKLTPEQRKQFIWYQPDSIIPFAQQPIAITLSFFQHVHGTDKAALAKVILQLELEPMLQKPLQNLSKGYRRRTLLALALLSRQPLLMLDEPFDGFDLRQSLAVMALLREYRQGRSMILSIHQLSEAEKICDRFLLLDQGRVLDIGTIDELGDRAGLALGATLEEVFLAIT